VIDSEEGGRRRKQHNKKTLNHIFRLQLEKSKYFKVVTKICVFLSLKGLMQCFAQIFRNKCLVFSGCAFNSKNSCTRDESPFNVTKLISESLVQKIWLRDRAKPFNCPNIIEKSDHRWYVYT